MEKQHAVELLKIAAQLSATSIAHKVSTESDRGAKANKLEAVFDDCVKAVQAHFEALVGKTE